jgi:5'-nucleotidase
MRILLSNDDGIHAPGLVALEKIARQLSEDIIIAAPETDQSGVAHSLSLNDPLRLRKVSDNRYAVSGTPTDCVLMAVHNILGGKRPDLLLSGVNRGQNIAEDITYSGTVAAAIEGTILGVPSIALSQAYGEKSGKAAIRWEVAESHAADVIRRVLALGIEANSLVNVNFPDCDPSEVKGAVAAVQGRRSAEFTRIIERTDGRGNPYYWIGYAGGPGEPHEGTDLWAIRNKRVSVTPLKIDLSDLPQLTRFAAEFGG